MTRILLIEDEPMNIAFFRAVLEHDGFEVRVEASGLIGRTVALSERFDLIITDIDLPGMDGIAIFRALERAGIRTPVIALSAFDEEWIRARAGSPIGFERILTKPITPSELRTAARSIRAASRC